MYFTLIFKNQENEGSTLCYDLCFHPCAVWFNNGKELLVPDPKIPNYQKDFLHMLITHESISAFSPSNIKFADCVIVVCHPEGHGTVKDLETLKADIKEEGFQFTVIENLLN